jgi:hypothetical protein
MNPSNSTPPTPAPPPLLSEKEARLRTDLYLQQRLNYQADYYQQRIKEFSFNADKMLLISAVLMGISTVIAASTSVDNSVWLPFITALLPAFAAAVSAFRSLYQWERQASIYEGTWLALQQARLTMPDEDFMKPGDYARYFPELVRQTEEVMRSEASQWGQVQSVEPKPTEEGAPSSGQGKPTSPTH